MMESLVDYVLERGKADYGQFSVRKDMDPNSLMYNHRKLLAYLFQEGQDASKNNAKNEKRISDMKIEEISGQLNYFSEKIHAEISKKHLTLDGDLYKLQNQWLRKKIPDFYCYYFLKFSFANSYSRMHQLFLSELQNMGKQRDSYSVVRKTIEARQLCLNNLKKQVYRLRQVQIQQGLQMIKQQKQLKKKVKNAKQKEGFKKKGDDAQGGGNSWKNQLQNVFEMINHFRKLTCYVVELIRLWKTAIYNMSEDPRRYRERVIFFHNDANYLLKMLFDGQFIRDSILKSYLSFSSAYDPFFLKPAMKLDNKKPRTENQDIFFELIQPNELDMDKITKALVILAEEEYDEDQQSRFINQRKNFGELEQRKQFIQRKRDALGLKSHQSQKKLPTVNIVDENGSKVNFSNTLGTKSNVKIEFTNNKKSALTQNQLQTIKSQREDLNKKSRIQTSLNRIKKIRSVDFKKVSPYLSRNERIEKAQKVIELEHKFRVAQGDYVQTLKEKKQTQMKEKVKGAIQANRQSISSKIFNRYIEENIRLMDEANKKSYLYKNHISPQKNKVASSLNYNRVSFHDRKEAEYQRNLQKYYPKEPNRSQINAEKSYGKGKGTKAIIEISNKGIRSGQKVIEYELTGKKGKNVGQILTKADKEAEQKLTLSKLSDRPTFKEVPPGSEEPTTNLFDSQKSPQIIIMRQQPQKLQEIKSFLYAKIKEQLMQEMKRSAEQKEVDLANMIQEEKRRKLQQIMEERRKEEERRKIQAQRMRLAQLEKERKKASFEIDVQPIQYSEQNVSLFFDQVFAIDPHTFHSMFTSDKVQKIKQRLLQELHPMFLRCTYEKTDPAYCFLHYNWSPSPFAPRSLRLTYLASPQSYLIVSILHNILDYLWKHDPVEIIELIIMGDEGNIEGTKIVEDIKQYAARNGEIFEKRLYSNLIEYRMLWNRPSLFKDVELPYKHYHFSKLLSLKSQLLSSALSLSQRHTPLIDMTLESFTSYIFLLEQIFRSYLTPEQVVELRQNSTNIRRLKDIFRIVLQLQKAKPIVDELAVIEGLSLQDLYDKLKDKKQPPYDKYYWHHFYDKTPSNRILEAILQVHTQFPFPSNSCKLDDRRFIRICPRRKVLTLTSSIYSSQLIYILQTNNPKIKVFLVQGEHFKLMRMELFIFLNLLFNNIVEDGERFVNSFWIPQFRVIGQGGKGKEVKRITDFSISMKKSFFLSQEIYFCNNEYIKSGVSSIPKQSDIIFRESFIFGMLHTSIEAASTGIPIYAKLIDKKEWFQE